jgi:Protein of unknown function (DUF3828)
VRARSVARFTKFFKVLLAAAVLAVLASASFGDDSTPLAFLESIYRRYEKSQEFVDISSAAKAARYFTPSVTKLIARDFAESKRKNEVGRLDVDPFINGQDWTPTKIELKVEPGSKPDRALGIASFTPPDGKATRSIKLDLAKTAAGWRISDIRWEGFGEGQPDSLVKILTAKE